MTTTRLKTTFRTLILSFILIQTAHSELIIEKYVMDFDNPTIAVVSEGLAVGSFLYLGIGAKADEVDYRIDAFKKDWKIINGLKAEKLELEKLKNLNQKRLKILKLNQYSTNSMTDLIKDIDLKIVENEKQLVKSYGLYKEKVEKGIKRIFHSVHYSDANASSVMKAKLYRNIARSMFALSFILSADILIEYMYEMRDEAIKDESKRNAITNIIDKVYRAQHAFQETQEYDEFF